jgi:hypothetical protein
MRTRVTVIAGTLSLLVFSLVPGPLLDAQIQSPATSEGNAVWTDRFATAKMCQMCHSSAESAKALKDAKGRSIGPHDLWRATMMANATVDPLWRAVVAAEVAATPSRKAEIEAKCLRCHAPMASVEAEFMGKAPSRRQFLHGNSTLTQLAADGVSCTVCHQISPDELGEDESFSGHFRIDNEDKIYGPHAQPFQMPMYRHTGYTPTESPHMRESALCAACHTLFTHSLDPDGSPTGHTLLEQGPYVEWQNSQFNDESGAPNQFAKSCQDCHVPTTDQDGAPIETRIARNPHGWDFPPLRPRSPFGRHVFVGGNTLVPSIIRDQLDAAGSKTAVAAFDARIQETRQMLRRDTAHIEIAKVERQDEQLLIAVEVSNIAGHKLPTAYPSRRVWVRLLIRDAAGKLVFASGEFDPRGRIVDGQGRILDSEQVGGPITPHRSQIDSPDQVQIYEAVMEDAEGETTYSLLRGARYRKDNRLLPLGWKSDHPRGAVTTPVATDEDRDFIAGADAVLYAVKLPRERGPYQVEASLHYQVLGSRYVAELLTNKVREMREFRKLHDAADPRPELLDRTTQSIDR